MVNGLVSVVVPVYNAERFIANAINSVLMQTYTNYEIVVIDDCSTDNSAKIILQLQAKHPQIKYCKLESNSGAAVARNKAIKLAKGQYVAFLDSDDCWKPEKLEKQIAFIQKTGAEFVFNSIEMINEHGKIIRTKINVPNKVDYKFILTNTIIATSTVLLDISRIGTFQMPNIRSGQDYATWLMLLRNGRVAYGIDEALTQYRRTSGSLSSRKCSNWKKVWRIQVEIEGVPPLMAYLHCVCYAINAIKKYYF